MTLRQLGLFFFLTFVLGPLIVLVAQSGQALLQGNGDWLALVIPEGRRLALLLQTFGLAAGVAAGGMVLGILVGSILWRWDRGPGAYLRWMVLVLAAVPPYIHALAWSSLAVAVNSLLQGVGIAPIPFQGYLASWWVQLMWLAPFAVGLALIGLKSVDPAIIEAARLARSDIHGLVKVVLPLAGPAIIAGGGILFLLSLLDYSVPSLFQMNVYSLEIFAEFSASNEPARAFLLAIPSLIIGVVVVLASQSVLRNAAQSPEWRDSAWKVSPLWPQWFVRAQWLLAAVMAAQVAVPVTSLIAAVGTLENMALALTAAPGELVFTFWIAGVSAAFAVLVALAVAREMAGAGGWEKLWWVLVTVPLAIPPPLVGIGLIGMWSRPVLTDVYGSSLMPALAALARFAPLAAIVLATQLRRTDPLLIDAARVMRTSLLRMVVRIWLPMMGPVLVGAFAVVFAFALGELGATLLVAPPGQATLTMRIYSFLHHGASSTVAGLCLLMTFMVLMVAMLAVLAFVGRSRLLRGTETG